MNTLILAAIVVVGGITLFGLVLLLAIRFGSSEDDPW
jgi:multisubunit Na+/H+ antiporter MnhC subunit